MSRTLERLDEDLARYGNLEAQKRVEQRREIAILRERNQQWGQGAAARAAQTQAPRAAPAEAMRHPYSKPALAAWFVLHVNDWQPEAPAPTEAEDLAAAKVWFGEVPRGDFREIRRLKVPKSWLKSGPRKGH